jgi:hypothetical protein
MDPQDQKRIVRELTSSIADSIIRLIDAGRIPAEWDGYELREMVFDRASASRCHIMQHGGNARARNYRNAVLTNYL